MNSDNETHSHDDIGCLEAIEAFYRSSGNGGGQGR